MQEALVAETFTGVVRVDRLGIDGLAGDLAGNHGEKLGYELVALLDYLALLLGFEHFSCLYEVCDLVP